MSWDLYAADLPPDVRSVAQLPSDYKPGPAVTPAQVLSAVQQAAPAADLSNESWVVIDGPDFSVEVSISPPKGSEPFVGGLAFHVRGEDGALGLIAEILDLLGVGAFDPQSESGIFQLDEATASLAAWRAYRDRTIGDGPA